MESSSSNGKMVKFEFRYEILLISYFIRFEKSFAISLGSISLRFLPIFLKKKKKKLPLIFERTLSRISLTEFIENFEKCSRFVSTWLIPSPRSIRIKKVTRTFREQIYAHPRRVSSRYQRGPPVFARGFGAEVA